MIMTIAVDRFVIAQVIGNNLLTL